MPWIKNEYIYTKRLLKAIATGYELIYEGLPVSWKTEIYNLWAIAEYKADFDMALNAIGRGHWKGELNSSNLADYRQFGHLQQIMIADMLGIDDGVLARLGFSQIPQLRGRAYKWMANYLNGVPLPSTLARQKKKFLYETRFITKGA